MFLVFGWEADGEGRVAAVDLNTYIGLISAPAMAGALDYSSSHSPILPWLRAIDGFNTHDDAFALAVAGGVTTVQVVPGSENVIGKPS